MVTYSNTDFYDVYVEDELRRVYMPPVSRRPASPKPDPFASETTAVSSPIIPTPPEEMPMRRLLWRALKRTLHYWFPPESSQIIAIIRMPERVYCAACGAVRVSKFCTGCGANMDRQFKKMVLKLARYVVEGTEDRRREIAQSVQEQVEIRMAEMAEQQRQRVEAKLGMLERVYVMQIVRQKQTIDQLLQGRPLSVLLSPEMSGKVFDTNRAK